MDSNYKITLSGKNVFLKDRSGSYGFYINIHTSSDCKRNAINKAMEMVNCRLNSNQYVKKGFEDTIDILVEEVVVNPPEVENIEQGFVWYRDDN
jgi:cell division GTPase FtsZ